MSGSLLDLCRSEWDREAYRLHEEVARDAQERMAARGLALALREVGKRPASLRMQPAIKATPVFFAK